MLHPGANARGADQHYAAVPVRSHVLFDYSSQHTISHKLLLSRVTVRSDTSSGAPPRVTPNKPSQGTQGTSQLKRRESS